MRSPGHRRAHRAGSAGALRIWSGLSEQAGRSHDDPFIAILQIRIPEMQRLEHAGREAFQHDIRPLSKSQYNLTALGTADIDRDASLARVEVVISDRAL